MPLECDDEFWDSPEPFQQPTNTPSTVAFFTHNIKLNQILATLLRNLVRHSYYVKGCK